MIPVVSDPIDNIPGITPPEYDGRRFRLENAVGDYPGRSPVDCLSAARRNPGALSRQGDCMDSAAAREGNSGDDRLLQKGERRMKALKRIMAVLGLILLIVVVSYLVFTGGQV